VTASPPSHARRQFGNVGAIAASRPSIRITRVRFTFESPKPGSQGVPGNTGPSSGAASQYVMSKISVRRRSGTNHANTARAITVAQWASVLRDITPAGRR